MLRNIVTAAAALAALGGAAGFGFRWSFRTKFRPVQDTIRRVNRRLFNPMQLRTAGQPGAYASVVHHVGRSSGTAYRTPVVAVPADEGFVIALPYGPGADWVRNVLAAGAATIEHEGHAIEVQRPELVSAAEVDPRFPAKERRLHERYGVTDFLRMSARPA